jgi:exonuclease V gamma subunit
VTRAATARAELERLLALRAEGLLRPLPLPCLSAEVYAAASLSTDEDPLAAARKAWTSTFNVTREDLEPEHQLAWGGELDFQAMGPLALALWEPLLSREVMESA